MNSKVRKMVLAALFIAMDIVFTRFLVINFGNTQRISLQFLPNALSGLFLGPYWGVLALAGGDVLGMLINSAGQAYFFGFTLTAALKGLTYGLMLYRREPTFSRVLTTMLVIGIFWDLGLNTLWLSIMYGTPFFTLLLSRSPFKVVTIAVATVVTYVTAQLLKKTKISMD